MFSNIVLCVCVALRCWAMNERFIENVSVEIENLKVTTMRIAIDIVSAVLWDAVSGGCILHERPRRSQEQVMAIKILEVQKCAMMMMSSDVIQWGEIEESLAVHPHVYMC